MLDVIRFDFDPTVAPFGLTVRLETLLLGAVILLVLVLIALRAGRERRQATAAGELPAGTSPADSAGRLRRDDLILIAFGVVPGAFVGGRLGYGLIHLDYYRANPSFLWDPGQGGLALTLAVVLGTLTGLAVARLLAAPIGRWLGVAGLPILLGLGLGKLTMVAGGEGQGAYSDSSWATSFAGPGPWGSSNPSYSALPSQALEGALVLAAVAVVAGLPLLLRLRVRRWRRVVRPGWSPRRDWSLLSGGRGFAVVLALWAAARFAAAFTWRDARVAGPLCVEQIVLLGLLAMLVLVLVVPVVVRRTRRTWVSRRAARAPAGAG
ncbi:MAG: prolipoprotein diacylglyceryl transferase family protein [Candidatus Limnocylindrales bacterium]